MNIEEFAAKGHQIISAHMAKAKAAELATTRNQALSTHIEACIRALWSHLDQGIDTTPIESPSPSADLPPVVIPPLEPIVAAAEAASISPTEVPLAIPPLDPSTPAVPRFPAADYEQQGTAHGQDDP